jgi:hypothetical protein
MSTNELIEKLENIKTTLRMDPDVYIEMVNRRFKSNRPLRYEDVYPYKVGSAAAEISILIDEITIDGIKEVKPDE